MEPEVKIQAPPGDKSGELVQPHILTQILEDEENVHVLPPPSPAPSSPPPTGVHEQVEGKYVCKLERKKSSIRRKRVLAAVTADDNKPIQMPLVEYGDQQDTYNDIANHVFRGTDVTINIRTLREKLGVLAAIRDACQRKTDVRLAREQRHFRRVSMRRALVTWTYLFILFIFLAIAARMFFIAARAYYGLIRDHIHQFRAT